MGKPERRRTGARDRRAFLCLFWRGRRREKRRKKPKTCRERGEKKRCPSKVPNSSAGDERERPETNSDGVQAREEKSGRIGAIRSAQDHRGRIIRGGKNRGEKKNQGTSSEKIGAIESDLRPRLSAPSPKPSTHTSATEYHLNEGAPGRGGGY